jgi:threonine aldolase
MNKNKTRFLGMHKKSHRYWIEKLSNCNHIDDEIDCYNQGPLVEKLESKVAELLGKQKALFFHKGTIAQLAVLKVAAANKNNNKVIIHNKCHIAIDEQDAYQHVTNLEGILLGPSDQPFNSSDIERIDDSVSSLVIEIPLRRVGFKLTPWNELINIKQWCHANNTHFHMDGARLWESTHYYNKSLAEISALFDSVYVSLYKGIGAIGGSLIAGDEEFINQCKIWRSRLGGDEWSQFPSLLTALDVL